MIALAVTQVAVSTPFDNSTDGWVANNVQAAIEEAPIHLRAAEVTITAQYTTTTTDTLVPGLTDTPTSAGTYLVNYSSDITSASAGAAISVSLYIGGVQKASTLRKIIPFASGLLTSGNARALVSISTVVTVNGSQAVSVFASSSTAGPTVNNGIMTWLRLT